MKAEKPPQASKTEGESSPTGLSNRTLSAQEAAHQDRSGLTSEVGPATVARTKPKRPYGQGGPFRLRQGRPREPLPPQRPNAQDVRGTAADSPDALCADPCPGAEDGCPEGLRRAETPF